MTRLNPTTKTSQTQELKNRNYPDIKDIILTNIKIDPVTSCWNWQPSRFPNGYGQIKAGGKGMGAHRLSYLLFIGEIPDGLCVCHRCDNKRCVNPTHLFMGSNADNSSDMVKKGRSARRRGEDHSCVKLTDQDVVLIRKIYATGAATQREIAERFGVGQANIGLITQRKTWTHLPPAA